MASVIDLPATRPDPSDTLWQCIEAVPASIAIYDRMQAFDDHAAAVMAATLLVVSVATLMATTALTQRIGARRG